MKGEGLILEEIHTKNRQREFKSSLSVLMKKGVKVPFLHPHIWISNNKDH